MFEDLPTTLGSGSQGFCLIAWFPVCFRTSSLSSEELLSSQWQSFTTTLATQAHGPITGRHQSPKPGQSEHFPESNTHTWVKAVLLVPGLDKMGWGSPGASDSHLYCHLRGPSHKMRPRGDGTQRWVHSACPWGSKVLWTLVFSRASPVSSPLGASWSLRSVRSNILCLRPVGFSHLQLKCCD